MNISTFKGSLNTNNSAFLLAGLIALVLCMPATTRAQGNLLVLPKRIVFDGSKRTQDLNLANTGKDSATYVISVIQIKMQEDGTFENITTPDSGQYFADKYLRIFPRSITLGPKESQTVKVQVFQEGNLAAGEYRSHIYFRAVPRTIAAGEKSAAADSARLSVQLVPVFGITIPAIIRIGENTSQADISDISVDLSSPARPQLNMYLNRIGNMSIYGDLYIDYVAATGKKTRIGTINGVAVYMPLARRKVTINLALPQGIDYHSGKLHVQYVLPSAAKTIAISDKELVLQ